MKTPKSLYELLGVDSGKKSVRKIFSPVVRNDFPRAFVNIVRNPARPGEVFTMHIDGDGSKFVQRLLHYLETGDKEIIQGAVDDALSMNTGDIAASGFVFGPWVITQNLAINGLNVPKDLVMEQIALRIRDLLGLYQSFGFNSIFFLGGETADLPDQVSSVVYDVDIYAEAKEEEIVTGDVKPGDKMYGFASDGQARWEQIPNSGIMTNGLTLGRTYTMHQSYGAKYPHLIRRGGSFYGAFTVADQPDILCGMTVSQALLSPTRQWAILIRRLMDRLREMGISCMLHGISLNTGGGATKIVHVGQGIVYEKTMPDPPPIFHLIQQESKEKWRNMYKIFNCGVGIDVVGEDRPEFKRALTEVSALTGIKMFELGVCRKSPSKKNRVILRTPFGNFDDY